MNRAMSTPAAAHVNAELYASCDCCGVGSLPMLRTDHGAEHRHRHRARDLPRQRSHGGALRREPVGQVAQARHHQRRHRCCGTEPLHRHQDDDQEDRRGQGELREADHRDQHRHTSHDDRPAGPDAVDEPSAEGHADHAEEGRDEEHHADAQRAEPAQTLELQRDEHEAGEVGAGDEHERGDRQGEGAVGEHAQFDQRVSGAQLVTDEQGEHASAAEDADERRPGRPSP